MSLQINYELTLVFQGPVITQTSGTIQLGLDAAMQYNQGLPALGGSLIKGNIRHTLNEFDKLLPEMLSKDIKQWFGEETSDEKYTPQRTQVDFDFFWTLTTPYEKTRNQLIDKWKRLKKKKIKKLKIKYKKISLYLIKTTLL